LESPRPLIDSVRASRDGHEYHEAWATRILLELLPPDTTLTAVSVEGFSKHEQDEVSGEAHDIADLVRYRGGRRAADTDQIETIQFKYSIANAAKPMRVSEMVKTVRKFAAADHDLQGLMPADSASRRQFELVTNRPIDAGAIQALAALQVGNNGGEEGTGQLDQLRDAIGLRGDDLASFAKRLTLTGSAGSLASAHHLSLVTLASWAGATDNLSRAHLNNLRQLVRERAGGRGQGDNLIERTDVLGALDIAHEHELYPIKASLPTIESPIERSVMQRLADEVFARPTALLVHAAGGVGKTALMQALERVLARDHYVVVFDGFGAGRWRDPADGRHLPHKALPHLANLLAADGLCDILLPSDHLEDGLSAFRDRLSAAATTLRSFRPKASVVLLLDAIDHCGMQAGPTGRPSFAQLLLKTLNVTPIAGVHVVASCRTHRRHLAQADANCREFEVPLFTREETERLIRGRLPNAMPSDITSLHRRSGGNPRLLDSLLRRGPPVDTAAPTVPTTLLDDILREQVIEAREHAVQRGATVTEAMGLLAGMAILPPPVPVDELAAALGLTASNIESFVADLFSLIESTNTGLVFRDEPTETVVMEMVEADTVARNDLLTRLRARQEQSAYAARALPSILAKAGAIDDLIPLALESLDSESFGRVGRRAIRLARLQAAATACASANRLDDLMEIALEAARVTSATERSDAYLRAHPDLVALCGDDETIRRFREDRRGWPGSRHAALGTFDAFASDLASAGLESGRAITWFNWALGEQRRDRSVSGFEDQALLKNALFVQLLRGGAVNVDHWLAGQSGAIAFSHAAAILSQADQYLRAWPECKGSARIKTLARCRSMSVAVLSAITTRLELPSSAARRVLSRLARLPTMPAESRGYDDQRQNEPFADGLIHAAGLATGLGLESESRTILKHVPAERVGAHDYSNPWITDRGVARNLRMAAVLSVARRRPARLADILPDDMMKVIPESIRRRGPAAIERRLHSHVSSPTKPRRRKGIRTDHGERQREWKEIINHRLEPLLPFIDLAAKVLKTRDPGQAIAKAVAEAKAAIAAAQSYPFRDQRQFLARRAFDVIGWACTCRTPLDGASGELLAALLEEASPIVGDWIETIARLARCSATHDSALRLAKRAEAVIAIDTSIGRQIEGYGALARALLLIGRNHAKSYFKIGLELADAVGSDDHDRIADLVAFSSRYSGTPLAPEVGHNFVRLCELNLPDESEKFDWRRFGNALAAIAGPSGLAPIARLADRQKIDLGWTLPPMLNALVERGMMEAGLAATIAVLAPFRATWTWSLPDLAKTIMSRLPQDRREGFAGQVVRELDREGAGHPRIEEVGKLKRLFDAELPPPSEARRIVSSLHASSTDVRKPEAKHQLPRGGRAFVDWKSIANQPSAVLRAALDAMAAEREGHRVSDEFLMDQLVRDVTAPGEREALLAAIVTDAEMAFEVKSTALEEANKHWRGQSRGLDEQIEQAAIDVALRGLDALVRPAESWRAPLAQIARSAGGRRNALIAAVVAALADGDRDISGEFWMSCALQLSETASPEAIGKSLGRYVMRAAAGLPISVSDGPWSTDFLVDDNPEVIVSELLWQRLGAPEAANRWRAAHALRHVAESGSTRLLDRLIRGCERTRAGAFQDPTLPFFHLNARLWLLIAVARIALDHPAMVAPHRATLEEIAASEAFPHILCRHFAAAALRTLMVQGLIADGEGYGTWLDSLNRPRGIQPRPDGRPNFYTRRPEGQLEPQPPFWFDYDFEKHVIDDVGDVFGLPTWMISDLVRSWIRRFDENVPNMSTCGRERYARDDLRGRSSSVPDIDLYGGQLAWHAVMLAAGQLAIDHLAVESQWDGDEWKELLRRDVLSRDDGLWMSDGTDLFPADHQPLLPPRGDVGDKLHVPQHPLDLLYVLGISDALALPQDLVVAGSWESVEGLDVTVSSQLTSESRALAVALAIYSGNPLFAYLPAEDEDDDVDRRDASERRELGYWLSGDRHGDARIDATDPYGSKTALQRLRPNRATANRLGLRMADPFGRVWTDKKGRTAFCAEAWGARRGQGRHQTERSGSRLKVEQSALMQLLASETKALLILVKVRKYVEKAPDDEKFKHRMLALIVRGSGDLEVIWSVPQRLQHALDRLGTYKAHEFSERIAVVDAIGRPRRQAWPRGRPQGQTNLRKQ
jgi:NACHT domain